MSVSSPFPLPIAFCAWGLVPGNEGVATLIARAKKMGAKSMAVEIGHGVTAADIKAIKDASLFVVGWDIVTGDTPQLLHDFALDGWCPQVESIYQLNPLISLLKTSGPWNTMPRAVVTTFGGLDTKDNVAALKAAGIDTAVVECYRDDGFPHWDLNAMVQAGVNYGFDRNKLIPLMGTYRGEHSYDYTGVADYGRSVGVYLLEPMSDEQLATFASLKDPVVATKTYWDCYIGNKPVHSELAITYPDGSTGLGKALNYLTQNIPDVRNAGAGSVERVTR